MALLATKGKAPGVYIQEITLPGPIAGVSTNIAAIVGPAKQGPLNKPTTITNINQFWDTFGDYIEDPYRVYAAHAVNGFFAEGGTNCYFVRVGNGKAAWLDLVDRSLAAQPTLVVTALREGNPTTATTVQVDDASIASTTVARASATIAAAGAPVNQPTVGTGSAADAANFSPGDSVLLTQGTNSELATISSISKDAGANTTTFTMAANLTKDYSGGAIRTADLAVGQQKIRVADTTGIEPGSYVSISDGTTTEWNVVRLVNTINNVLTLTNGLANLFKMGSGDPAVAIKSMEFTLTIVSTNAGTEVFKNLSMDPRHSRYFANIVSSGAVDVEFADPPSSTPPAKNLPKVITATALAGGKDEDLTALTTAHYHAGIDTLKKLSDVNLLCVPDTVGSKFNAADTQDIQAYMIAHCQKMQDRFAILDCREIKPTVVTFDDLVTQRQNLNSDNGYGALYFPWILISNPFGSGRIPVPPSGHTAGVFANNDNNFGVFKAPANEQITSALAVEVTVTDDEQGPLNDQGINVIRAFPSEGVKIWGARTIAPPDITAWRFVNVRRLLLFIEKSIQEGTRFAVFEPNNLTLWQQIKRLVTAFLNDQWTEGALFGDTPDKAFRVRVDETLNPPEIRAQGILVVEVTVVPTTPAEFIVFQVIQDITGTSLQESTAA